MNFSNVNYIYVLNVFIRLLIQLLNVLNRLHSPGSFNDAFRQDVKESFRFLTGSLKLFERTDSLK